MDALKTAYATAYSRLLLLAKEGKIGEVYSVDATCTSLRSIAEDAWDSICDWGPTAMLPMPRQEWNMFWWVIIICQP